MKKTFTLVAAPLAAFLFLFQASPADAANPSAVDCNFAHQIQTLKKNAEGGRDSVAVLTLRKNILRDILNCAGADADGLRGQIEKIEPANPRQSQIRERLINDLATAARFYTQQADRIDGFGIYGTKEFARMVREWREVNYAPLAQQASNFILWKKNQPLFAAAQKRYDYLKPTVSALSLVEQEKIPGLFENVRASFESAASANEEAGSALERNISPDETLDKIKRSLAALADTYENFSHLADAITDIIPH